MRLKSKWWEVIFSESPLSDQSKASAKIKRVPEKEEGCLLAPLHTDYFSPVNASQDTRHICPYRLVRPKAHHIFKSHKPGIQTDMLAVGCNP